MSDRLIVLPVNVALGPVPAALVSPAHPPLELLHAAADPLHAGPRHLSNSEGFIQNFYPAVSMANTVICG